MSHDGEVRGRVEQACLEFEKDLRAFLLGVLRDHELAEDALQRTMIRAIEGCEGVRLSTLRGWLFRIALNEGRQLRRSQARHRKLLKQAVWSGAVARESSASENQQLTELYTEERQQAVREVLAELPDEQADVVRRRIQLDQTFAEIAAELQCPLGTVLTRMRRALIRLRESPRLKNLLDEAD